MHLHFHFISVMSRDCIEYQTIKFRLWEFFAMLFSSSHFLLAWLLAGTGCEFKTLVRFNFWNLLNMFTTYLKHCLIPQNLI